MLKQFFALVRGRAYEAARPVDRNALTILRQQIRDCAAAIDAARKAVAIAIAQNEQEIEQYKKLVARIDDLESRTFIGSSRAERTCPRGGRDHRAAGSRTRRLGGRTEELRHRDRTDQAHRRNRKCGCANCSAASASRRPRTGPSGCANGAPDSGLSALKDAEETLTRLRLRQKAIDAAAAALDEMEQSVDPAAQPKNWRQPAAARRSARPPTPCSPGSPPGPASPPEPDPPVISIRTLKGHDHDTTTTLPRTPAPGRCSPWRVSALPPR